MLAETGGLENGGHATCSSSIVATAASAADAASQQRARAALVDGDFRRRLDAAAGVRRGTARRERAAWRQGGEIGRLALDCGETIATVGHPWNRAEQRLGVGMGGRGEDLRNRSMLDHPSGVHHCELVAHLGDDAEIVGDEDQRRAHARAADRASRLRYCAWMVRSRLVVGSSAISRRGSQEMPIAPTIRWRMPPDISCGNWVTRVSAEEMRTDLSRPMARTQAPATARAFMDAERLADLIADGE